MGRCARRRLRWIVQIRRRRRPLVRDPDSGRQRGRSRRLATTRTMPAIVNTYVKGAYRTNDGGATWVERNVILGVGQQRVCACRPTRQPAILPQLHCRWNDLLCECVRAAQVDGSQRVVGEDRSGRLSDFDISTVHHRGLAGLCPGPDGLRRSTRQGDIYRSTGRRLTWSLLCNLGAPVRSLVLSPQFPADPVVYASTSGGIFKSDDAGATWQPTGPPGPRCSPSRRTTRATAPCSPAPTAVST